MTAATQVAEPVVTVRMAGMEVVADGVSLKTVLGSCVAVIVRDAERGISGLAHVMLPRKMRSDDSIGKYADSAIPALLERIASRGGRTGSMQALLIGGAHMFGSYGDASHSVGDQNVEAARRMLSQLGIRIVHEEIGGTHGRTVVFNNSTGKAHVKTLEGLKGRTATS
jgi:chemotaxis protein CheD